MPEHRGAGAAPGGEPCCQSTQHSYTTCTHHLHVLHHSRNPHSSPHSSPAAAPQQTPQQPQSSLTAPQRLPGGASHTAMASLMLPVWPAWNLTVT
jgi:hypothetical protein